MVGIYHCMEVRSFGTIEKITFIKIELKNNKSLVLKIHNHLKVF